MAKGGTGNLQARIRESTLLEGDCWIWQLSKRNNGYGQIKLSNPEHLAAVTQKNNLNRAKSALATINNNKTHCIHGHEFSLINTRIMSDGSRECKTCRIETKKRWRESHGTGR